MVRQVTSPVRRAAGGLWHATRQTVLVALEWLPGLALNRGAASAAASVGGDPAPALLGGQAELHAAGQTCSRCGRLFGEQDVVRVLRAGPVHDACPA